METAKISLWEVIIGIWLLAAVVVVAGLFWTSNPLAYVLGELVGSLTASAMMLHLYHSIDIELDLPEKKAVNHSRAMGTVRAVAELAVLAGSFMLPDIILPYTVLAGLLSRKFAALMVPVIERVRLAKIKMKGE